MLLPGAGFDVVPSDCLAVHLKQRLPGARRLTLAYGGVGRLSRGTATTAIESLGEAALVRRGGVLTPVPAGVAHARDRLRRGAAPRDHGAPRRRDDRVALDRHPGHRDPLRRARRAAAPRAGRAATSGPLLASGPVRRALLARVRAGAPGPTDEERARGRAFVWGEVEDARRPTGAQPPRDGRGLHVHGARRPRDRRARPRRPGARRGTRRRGRPTARTSSSRSRARRARTSRRPREPARRLTAGGTTH